MSWTVVFTKQARRDAKKLSDSGLKSKAEDIIQILRENPFQVLPSNKKLVGDLAGAHSRRIHIQRRIGSVFFTNTGWGLYDDILDDYLSKKKAVKFNTKLEVFRFFQPNSKLPRGHFIPLLFLFIFPFALRHIL